MAQCRWDLQSIIQQIKASGQIDGDTLKEPSSYDGRESIFLEVYFNPGNSSSSPNKH